MKYVSFCSGVEAASQAWKPLGWEPVAFSEIEPFPCAVLASRFPDVPNLGDMTKIHYDRERKELTNGTDVVVCEGGIDLVVGGTPCQSFSVAGKREGLAGASGLAFHYVRLLGEISPRYFVWENVPGCMSSRTYGGRNDFNFLLHEFAKCGYVVEHRVLDTQFTRVLLFRDADGRMAGFPCAVPQRRRRVFAVGTRVQPVGHPPAGGGGWRPILLEPEGVLGDPPPRRVKGQGAAGDPADGAGGAGGAGAGGGIPSVPCGTRPGAEAGGVAKTPGRIDAKFPQRAAQEAAPRAAEGVECLTPPSGHPQTHRVYGTGGAYPSIMSNGGQAGQDQSGVLVRDAVAFKGGQSAAGGLGAEREVAQTMQRRMSALEPTVAISFLPAGPARSRSPGEAEEVAPAMARGGGAGGNRPGVAVGSVAVRTGHTKANGCGVQEEVSHALGAGDLDAVAYKLDSTASNSMRSANPKSGFHEVGAHCALDTADPSPSKAQGGIALAVPVALRGNRRAGEEGKLAETDGTGAAYSLTHVLTDSMVATKEWRTTTGAAVYPTVDGSLRKCVGHQSETGGYYVCGPVPPADAAACENRRADSRVVPADAAPCAGAAHGGGRDSDSPLAGCRYAVRRITPTEGERLQGFADGWTVPAFRPEDLSDALCDRFAAVHAGWAAASGRPAAKPKPRESVRRWLAGISSPETCPDGPRYKAIGNSMSVNVMMWVGMRIERCDRARRRRERAASAGAGKDAGR